MDHNQMEIWRDFSESKLLQKLTSKVKFFLIYKTQKYLWEILYGKPRHGMQIPLLKFLDAARKKWWITSM